MPIQATDWYSVLGGEVSPYVQKRADMAKFGKWLDNAENIRLDLLGGFMNRPGFVYLSETRNIGSKIVKLIPFEYSRNDSYVIELGDNYFSIFNKDVGYINDSTGNPSKFVSYLNFSASTDVSYSQVGNFLYIANGVGKPYVIKRITNQEWIMEEFDYQCIPPLLGFNQNNQDKISLSRNLTGFNSNTIYKIIIDSLNFNENTILPFVNFVVVDGYSNSISTSFSNIALKDLHTSINSNVTIGTLSPWHITASYSSTSLGKAIYVSQASGEYENEYKLSGSSIVASYGEANTGRTQNLYSKQDNLSYQGTYPSDSPIEFLRNTKFYSSNNSSSPHAFTKTSSSYFEIDVSSIKFNSFTFAVYPQGFTFTDSSMNTSAFWNGKNGVGFCSIEDGTLHHRNGNFKLTYSGEQTQSAIYEWLNTIVKPKIDAMALIFMPSNPIVLDISTSGSKVCIHFKSHSFSCKSVNPAVTYTATFVEVDGTETSSAAYFTTVNVGSPYYTTSSGVAPMCYATSNSSPTSDSGVLYCSYYPTVTIEYRTYPTQTLYSTNITTSTEKVVALTRAVGTFENTVEGDVFAIYNTVPSRSVASPAVTNGGTSVAPTLLFEGYTNGNLRIVTNGNWKGTLKLQYVDSTTNHEYIDLDTISSESTLKPNNINKVYEIDSPDDTILVKLFAYNILNEANSSELGLGPMSLIFVSDSFQNIVYCKVIQKSSSTKVFAEILSGEYKCATPSFSETIDTDIWRPGAWGDTNGYPKYVFFVQNRIGFARTPTTPQGVWLSRIDEHNDFKERVKYLDDNPVSIIALGLQQHEVTGVQSLKDFFIFTLGQELGIYSDSAITQKNKQLIPFSYYGSEPIESQVSGSRLLFVEKGGRNVRELVYSFQVSNYDSNDMTLLVQHLLKNRKIISTAKLTQQEKEILFLTDDGTVLVFKHLPEQEIYAWTHWSHSKYKITNVASIPDSEGNQILYIVCEDSDGNKHIEYMPYSRNHFFADTIKISTTEQFIDSETGLIKYSLSTGYPENTSIVVKDNYTTSTTGVTYKLTTDSAGKVYFSNNPGTVVYGFPITSLLSFVSPVIGSQSGNSSSFKKSIFKVYYDYNDSNGFSVGVNNEKFSKPNLSINPNSNLEDYKTKVYSGTCESILECSFTRNSKLTFKQEEPFQMYITNVKALIDYGGQ